MVPLNEPAGNGEQPGLFPGDTWPANRISASMSEVIPGPPPGGAGNPVSAGGTGPGAGRSTDWPHTRPWALEANAAFHGPGCPSGSLPGPSLPAAADTKMPA